MISPFLKPVPDWKSRSLGADGIENAGGVGATTRHCRWKTARSKRPTRLLRDVEHEVNRLRHALAYRERSRFQTGAGGNRRPRFLDLVATVTINRGKEDGIESDMPVVTDEGLVGKTTTVSDNISIVLLVSDENCRVAAKVEGTREQGIVSGERVAGGANAVARTEFSVETGQPAARPKSLHLGSRRCFSVRSADRNGERFQVRELDGQAQLTPAVDLSHLEDVFVVTGHK